jgi:hypothetical protein
LPFGGNPSPAMQPSHQPSSHRTLSLPLISAKISLGSGMSGTSSATRVRISSRVGRPDSFISRSGTSGYHHQGCVLNAPFSRCRLSFSQGAPSWHKSQSMRMLDARHRKVYRMSSYCPQTQTWTCRCLAGEHSFQLHLPLALRSGARRDSRSHASMRERRLNVEIDGIPLLVWLVRGGK